MFFKEALTWRQLSHPYVLPFFGVNLDTFPGYMAMVSPWMTVGTVIQHIHDSGVSGLNIDALVNFHS
jgi:serine/threonine-protein kinase TNNI3K